MTFKNEKGLTLIELLITIAVIAIVAAISIPVITNVIESSRTSSAGSMEAQVNAFIEKYAASGAVTFNGTDTFTGWVDLDADGVVDANEAIETFTVDTAQFGLSGTPNASTPQTGDSYATFSTVEATVTVGGAATGGTQAASFTYTLTAVPGGGDFGGSGSCNVVGWTTNANDLSFYCSSSIPASTLTAFSTLEAGDPIQVTFYNFSTSAEETRTLTYSSQDTSQSPWTILVSETLPQGELLSMSF
jgi:prepilin-type N-terminal cleavage/methylation domain-containing protein